MTAAKRPGLCPGVKNICRHCGAVRAWSSRGLCWSCWHSPDVLPQYPRLLAHTNNRSLGQDWPSKPCVPTVAAPGSVQKLAVLRGRLRRGEQLFHTRDARKDLS